MRPQISYLAPAKAAQLCAEAAVKAGLTPVARVAENERTMDVALRSANAQLVVLRCVERPTSDDFLALATMLREGDFERAALVRCDGREPTHHAEIETCSLDSLPRLLRRWVQECAPL